MLRLLNVRWSQTADLAVTLRLAVSTHRSSCVYGCCSKAILFPTGEKSRKLHTTSGYFTSLQVAWSHLTILNSNTGDSLQVQHHR